VFTIQSVLFIGHSDSKFGRIACGLVGLAGYQHTDPDGFALPDGTWSCERQQESGKKADHSGL
jgi:hypothetical protein